MIGTQSKAQNFGLYYYQGGFLSHIPLPLPSLTYSFMAGEKARKVRRELCFSIAEYFIPLEK